MKKIVSFWIIVAAEAAKEPHKFYLTQGTFTGLQATTACASGYHMASLWEIFDVTNLKYDTTLGFIKDDSGSGPISFVFGWIRTGEDSNSTSGFPGIDNCNAWTSDSAVANGTVVELFGGWNTPGTAIAPWFATVLNCSSHSQVWCVQD
jgi:hypothetical protein